MARVHLSFMVPPRQPPDQNRKGSPRGRRYRYWVRRSDEHPMVQSYPNEIVDGMAALINSLKDLRSPSPRAREFSRFSSQPATPDAMAHGQAHGQSSQQPGYSYSFPPAPFPAMTPGQSSQQPMYSYPPPPPPFPRLVPPHVFSTHEQVPHTFLPQQLPPPTNAPPPVNAPLPLGGSSQSSRGEHHQILVATPTNHVTEIESPIISVVFPVDSDIIGAPTTEGVCSWDTRKLFPEFLAEMCKRMQLNKDTAALGYKFSGDRKKDLARQLLTAEEYGFAMNEIRSRVRNARTKEHKLVLHNLVSTSHAFPSEPALNSYGYFIAPETVCRHTKGEIWG